MNGGAGSDKLTMGAGNASINGGGGADTITGGAGSTTMNGGKGNDVLVGGAGRDYFYYTNGDGNDVIKGMGDDDVIVLGTRTTMNTAKSGMDANGIDYTLVIGSGSIKVQNAPAKLKVLTSPTSSSPIEIETTPTESSERTAGYAEYDELFNSDNYATATELETILNVDKSAPTANEGATALTAKATLMAVATDFTTSSDPYENKIKK